MIYIMDIKSLLNDYHGRAPYTYYKNIKQNIIKDTKYQKQLDKDTKTIIITAMYIKKMVVEMEIKTMETKVKEKRSWKWKTLISFSLSKKKKRKLRFFFFCTHQILTRC
jgi:hypothetical protein